MSKKFNYFSAIKFLFKYINQYKKQFLMFYFGWLLDTVLMVMIPILFGIMINEIVYYQEVDSFLKIAFLFVVCIIFSCGLYFLLYAQHGYLMNMYVFSIRKDIFNHLEKCQAKYLTDCSTGELLALLQRYPEECMHFVIRNMIHTLNGAFLIFAYAIYLINIEWKIGIAALIAALLTSYLNTRFRSKIQKLGDNQNSFYSRNVSWIYEMITALRDIRLLGAKRKAEEIFEGNQKQLLNSEKKISVASLNAESVISLIKLIVRLAIYVIAAFGAVDGTITLGMLTVIFCFYDKMERQIQEASQYYLDAQTRVTYIQKIHDFLNTPMEQEGNGELIVYNGEIEFKNVTFGYEDRNSFIRNINLKINAGEKVAIIGKSGCGKTTLASLLIGFYQPNEGTIMVDKQRLDECRLDSIRSEIGIVQQDVLIFHGTIKQNLLMGNCHANDEQLQKACEAAGISDFIHSLEIGMDTVIGIGGIDLSGGQKQRIAIARIILRNPSILILDEATSALDKNTEEAIHKAWKSVFSDKTIIMISHRQSSVMLCEQAYIIEEGRIVENGTPEFLMRNSKRFQTLFAIKEELNYE